MFGSENATADLLDQLPPVEAVLAVDGSEIDVEFLRAQIREIQGDTDDSDPRSLIGWPSKSIITFKSQIFDACGHVEEFNKFFEQHGDQTFFLTPQDRELLTNCLSNVFEFLDVNLPLPAPGFYQRFSPRYVEESVNLGYLCGFRTQKSFAMFSLSIWLLHPNAIEDREDFQHTCLKFRPANRVFSLGDYEHGATDIASRALYPFLVFGNWEDAVRYSAYQSLVIQNWKANLCDEILRDYTPNDDTFLTAFSEEKCYEFWEKTE